MVLHSIWLAPPGYGYEVSLEATWNSVQSRSWLPFKSADIGNKISVDSSWPNSTLNRSSNTYHVWVSANFYDIFLSFSALPYEDSLIAYLYRYSFIMRSFCFLFCCLFFVSSFFSFFFLSFSLFLLNVVFCSSRQDISFDFMIIL